MQKPSLEKKLASDWKAQLCVGVILERGDVGSMLRQTLREPFRAKSFTMPSRILAIFPGLTSFGRPTAQFVQSDRSAPEGTAASLLSFHISGVRSRLHYLSSAEHSFSAVE